MTKLHILWISTKSYVPFNCILRDCFQPRYETKLFPLIQMTNPSEKRTMELPGVFPSRRRRSGPARGDFLWGAKPRYFDRTRIARTHIQIAAPGGNVFSMHLILIWLLLQLILFLILFLITLRLSGRERYLPDILPALELSCNCWPSTTLATILKNSCEIWIFRLM